MSTKTFLFSYGTLQEEQVQLALYNRKLIGFAAVLKGYQLASKKIAGKYPILIKTENAADAIEGMVFEISNKELLKTDSYEGIHYTRVKEILPSGVKAWCYIQQQ